MGPTWANSGSGVGQVLAHGSTCVGVIWTYHGPTQCGANLRRVQTKWVPQMGRLWADGRDSRPKGVGLQKHHFCRSRSLRDADIMTHAWPSTFVGLVPSPPPPVRSRARPR